MDYEYGRVYNPSKRYNIPKRATIGKLVTGSSDTMYPNSNFLKYFPETEFPEDQSISSRSSCLRIGAYALIKSIIENYNLRSNLSRYMQPKDVNLFLDLATYSIVDENNAAQYYPAYAYNHPLFTDDMHIYSDSKISSFLNSITEDQIVGFLNDWNAKRRHRERFYISYFNYSMAYDTFNKEPLFYEEYPGSIVDVS